MRSYKKHLFESLSLDDLQRDGDWIPWCTDFATMIPIVERAKFPVSIPEYLYYHERTTANTKGIRKEKDEVIRWIISKPGYETKDPVSAEHQEDRN